MKPICVSEQLMYTTVRLETDTGCGTGSYFNFQIEDLIVPVIITNKHVVNNRETEKVQFYVHLKDKEGNPSDNLKIEYNTHWIFHRDKDLCACYVNPLFEEIKNRYDREVFFIANDANIVPSQSKLEELSAIEELVMVGYPIGLWDQKNNLPIFRKGFTACHPGIDFNERGIGLADMSCFPGSSGSPIYIFNSGGYQDKRGNMYIGTSRLLLLGYLYAGPQYTVNGSLIKSTIPTQQTIMSCTPFMVNLGYYVKSTELQFFLEKIKSTIEED